MTEAESDQIKTMRFSEGDLDGLMKVADILVSKLETVGDENSQQAGESFGDELILAHRLALGAAANMLLRNQKNAASIAVAKAQHLSERLLLVISFLQGTT